jgi:hypothetical protein
LTFSSNAKWDTLWCVFLDKKQSIHIFIGSFEPRYPQTLWSPVDRWSVLQHSR